LDECKISARSTKGCPDFVVGPPHSLNDHYNESIRPTNEEGAVSNSAGKGLVVICNLIVDYRVEVGDRGKVSKEHVDKGVIALLVSFAACAHASMGKIKFKDKVCKVM
jgi:hypothetical protein